MILSMIFSKLVLSLSGKYDFMIRFSSDFCCPDKLFLSFVNILIFVLFSSNSSCKKVPLSLIFLLYSSTNEMTLALLTFSISLSNPLLNAWASNGKKVLDACVFSVASE